ncbi:MAG: RNA degradosome polyphosphate kinase, partial [Candidatus Omnitrophota bacterium]
MTEQEKSDPKERFIHRDLSWLSFNERVLEEATDLGNPLLERLKFLAIFAGNLDEFYMVRVSGLKKLLDSGFNKRDDFGYYPQDLFAEIKTRTDFLSKKISGIYEGQIKKELEKNQIFFKTFEQLNNEQKRFAKRFFETTLFPVITPMAVDQGRPFPVLPSKTMAFAVNLTRKDELHLAIIPVPKNMPRLLKVPSEKEEINFVFIDELIRENLKLLFKGYNIVDQSIFRVIRDSELYVDEEYASDLLKAIEEEVKKRPRARVVYLEIEKTCSPELLDVLCQGLSYAKEEVVSTGSNLDLTYLYELIPLVDRPQLGYRSFVPAKIEYENIYDRIHQGDFIAHVPFQSFYPTVDLIQTAASDENV